MSDKLKFPKGFLWGTATSSHQVEGGNTNNDWYEWEEAGKTKDKSGKACDYWNRFREDHNLAKELGCNSLRISLEWSRIEPKEGEFSQEAIEHYREILRDIKEKGMKRVVTLWHWTLPFWFSHKYGWHSKESVRIFSRYSEKVVQELGEEIDIFISMNEPRLPLNRGYLKGDFPPGKMNPFLYFRARRHMTLAHKKCYEIVKRIRRDLPVGLTQFTNDFFWSGTGKWQNWLTEKVENFYNWHFFEETKEHYDFIGINYYFSVEIKIFPPSFQMKTTNHQITEMGWGVFPDGFYEIIMDAWKKFQKPIYIFENGIANAKDDHRTEFIKKHLEKLHQAISDGADVRGYFHWSLMDNFEWNDAYDRKFGLVEIDFETLERKPRKSFYEYGKICKNNEIEIGG